MSDESYAEYDRLIKSPYGMVICAGPTGSGKTTTLYATLAEIDREEINIMTIEDPVEYVFPSINQIQINPLAGVTFATGLRSILRQDPDAILVGEIRDVDTARIAVQAAMTGHFVMSSLHATDATSALHRFMDMGIEPFLVASSLLGVVGQRLIRKVCANCTALYQPTAEERAFYEVSGGHVDKTDFVHGNGCNVCGQTGYYDRVGIYEVLPVDDDLKDLIVAQASLAALRDAAAAVGMRTLRDQAVDLVETERHHRRRGAPHRVRALTEGLTKDQCHASATRPSPRTAPRSRTSSTRSARRSRATSCSSATSRCARSSGRARASSRSRSPSSASSVRRS